MSHVMKNEAPKGKIRINMIPYLPAIEPVVLTGDKLHNEYAERDFKDDQSPFYPTPGLTSDLYAYRLIEDANVASYNHFPALIHVEDGSPWPLGNLYLSKLAFEYKPTSRPTLKKIALSLVDFVNTLIDEELDMFTFPKPKARRPTYAYSQQLGAETLLNPDTSETSNQHISKVENFYRWLNKSRGLKPENPMWKESTKNLQYHDDQGFTRLKEYITTDLRLIGKRKASKSQKLEAYNAHEQTEIIDALLALNNTEMTLVFLTAILAGPRMQSILTTPRSIFKDDATGEYLRMNIGYGTPIDSKYNRKNCIYIPRFLKEMVLIYLQSERYKLRNSKSPLANSNDNYVYLTKTGRPYYSRRNDPYQQNYKNPQEGGAIHSFIRNQLQPRLILQGSKVKVRFHNLRATFANNLACSLLERYEKNELTMTQVLTTVCDRLGQKKIVTTERYLEGIKKSKIDALTQDKWERHLEERIRRSFGDAHDTYNNEAKQHDKIS